MASFEIKPSQTVNVNLAGFTGGQTRIVSSATANTWTKGQVIINCTTDTIADFYIYSVNESFSTSDSVQVRNIQLTDLTLAFGSTIADYLYSLTNNGGITKLRGMGCPIDKYTPYGYGLYSVKTSGKKIIGKNQLKCDSYSFNTWNGITFTNNGDGTITANGTASANTFFPVESDWTSYELLKDHKITQNMILSGCPSNGSVTTYGLYMRSGNAANRADLGSGVTIQYSEINTYYPCIFIGQGYTANNLVFKPMMRFATISDDTFEPYSSTIYPLGNDELRGKFDLVNGEIVASGDVKESNGNTKRYWGYVADISTLSWSYNSGTKRWFALLDGAENYGARNTNILSSHYTVDTNAVAGDNGKCFFADKGIYVYSTDSVNVPIGSCIYELATPTTEQSTPFADPMSLVGATTEEYIDDRTIPCPVGAERQYMGQSEDVVEIPSSPMADGKRVLTSYKSGDKEQLVWEDLGFAIASVVKSYNIGTSGASIKMSNGSIFMIGRNSAGVKGIYMVDSQGIPIPMITATGSFTVTANDGMVTITNNSGVAIRITIIEPYVI